MKAQNMKKVPSALKWLAEKRARIAGECLSCDQTIEYLEGTLLEARSQLTFAETALAAAITRKERISLELESMDRVVQLYDAGIDPEQIGPINAWQGNYGKRGALREFLSETLRGKAPDYLSTRELELLTTNHFSLAFKHLAERKKWYDGSFRNTLKVLASQGLIERKTNQVSHSPLVGYWRWKQEPPKTLAELQRWKTVPTPPVKS